MVTNILPVTVKYNAGYQSSKPVITLTELPRTEYFSYSSISLEEPQVLPLKVTVSQLSKKLLAFMGSACILRCAAFWVLLSAKLI